MQLILASASKGRAYLLKQLKIPFEIMHTNMDEEKIMGKNPAETVQLRAKLKGEEAAARIQNSVISHQQLSTDNRQLITYLVLTADTEVILGNQLIGKPKDYNDAIKIFRMLSGKTHEVISGYNIIKIPITKPEIRINIKQPKMPILKTELNASKERVFQGIDTTWQENWNIRRPGVSDKFGIEAEKIYHGYDRSFVTFRKLTHEDIKIYLSLTEYIRYTGGYALIACPQCLHQTIQKMISPKKLFPSHCRYLPYVGDMHGRRASPQTFITKIEGSISNVIGLPLEKIIPILSRLQILNF